MKEPLCTRCIFDTSVPNIDFDAEGVCNYCRQINDLEQKFPNDSKGERELERLVAEIKASGQGRQYDALIGVSGGCDSSYLMHVLAKEHGLRLLAVHFDNTWNSTIATENIQKMTRALKIDLHTHVVDAREFDDLHMSFMRAGVMDVETPTDIGLAATMALAAEKYKTRYRIDGHSFRTEGSAPMGLIYMDARYIKSVHGQYGTGPVKSFPNLWLHRQLRWMLLRNLKIVRPIYYMDYDKEAAQKLLTEQYGWTWYGGHHLENRMTTFYHSYLLPTRWDVDLRIIGYSAQVRDGRMSRAEALELMKQPPHVEDGLLDYYKKRMRLSDADLDALLRLPYRYYTDFRTYKKLFERMRPFFHLMAKTERIPWSFYIKYTLPHEVVRRENSLPQQAPEA